MDLIKEIKDLKIGEVIENANLKDYTTYKINCIATCICFPTDTNKLIILIKLLKVKKAKYKIIGRGSNLIFKADYNGVLIRLDKINHLKINKNIIKVGVGYPLIKLSLDLSKMGYTGLEFASGIPGSVGGAVYMNAGAYDSNMSNIIKSVKVLTPTNEIIDLSNNDMNFDYRKSFLQDNRDYICLEATIVLKKGNNEEILNVINERRNKRMLSQPLEFPSAGSVFRNPENNYAGKLIEESNLKGLQVGDAKVSEKHANFIINTGSATGNDIVCLIDKIKKIIKENYDIDLKVEQEIVE